MPPNQARQGGLRNQIPIRTHNWDISRPGFVEADTVAHCGNSLAGDFIWSLTLTDIHTGWTESRATWNNGAAGVIQQIKNIEASLTFPLKGFDCDNGGEFLNRHLIRYFSDHKPKLKFTRSRPYKKNDNAHVVELINNLYANEWSLYQNHFCPTLKLKDKQRINSKYYKKYETPRTPCQRLMQSPHVSNENKKTLDNLHQTLDPFKLTRQIDWPNYSDNEKTFMLAVKKPDKNTGSVEMEIFGIGGTWLQHKKTANSTASPANCLIPECVVVGAVDHHDYSAGQGANVIMDYSSRGPTNGGNRSVDLVGPTNTNTVSAGTFTGTSCAAPNAAGTAAVHWSAFPNHTALEVLSYLLQSADINKDWGSNGYDHTYGRGGIFLPDCFPTEAIFTVWQSIFDGSVHLNGSATVNESSYELYIAEVVFDNGWPVTIIDTYWSTGRVSGQLPTDLNLNSMYKPPCGGTFQIGKEYTVYLEVRNECTSGDWHTEFIKIVPWWEPIDPDDYVSICMIPGGGFIDSNSIAAGEEVRFDIWLRNLTDTNYNISNGFRVYSPDGATWDSLSADFTGTLGPEQFDASMFVNCFSCDGISEDTVGFAGVAIFGTGLPGQFDNLAYSITIYPGLADTGKTICIDSTWFPPSNTWLWAGINGPDTVPGWYGPYCFTIDAPQYGSISGTKFDDVDGDSKFDTGEPGLDQVVINLDGPVSTSIPTNLQGEYSFTNLPPGIYTVSEDIPIGSVPTYPTSISYTITLQWGENVTEVDFGNYDTSYCEEHRFDTCLAGTMDNFVEAEPSSPSEDLLLLMTVTGDEALAFFDSSASGHAFGHTFDGCWSDSCIVVSAEICLRIRATGAVPTNDALHLGDWGNNGSLWWISMNDLIEFQSSGSDNSWDSGDDMTVCLDLTSLPVAGNGAHNVLAALQDGNLDVYIQNDTEVDYITIMVELCCDTCFTPGDINNDGIFYQVADLVYLQGHLNYGGPAPDHLWSADLNGDCLIDQTDIDLYELYFECGWSCVDFAECTCLEPLTIYGTPCLLACDFDGIIYDLDPNTGELTKARGPGLAGLAGLSLNPVDSLIYGVAASYSDNSSLYTVDPTTGETQLIGQLGLESFTEGDCDFDPTDSGQMYAIGHDLMTINTSTGQATVIGSFNPTAIDPSAMAFDKNGVLWVLDVSAELLFKIDKSNGDIVSSIGFNLLSPASSLQGMDFYPAGGDLYIGTGNTFEGLNALYTLDTVTGEITEVGNHPGVSGLEFFGVGPCHPSCCIGMRGNVDDDGSDAVNVADLTYLVTYLFQGGPEPVCVEESDVNGDSNIDIADLTYLVAYLFQGGPPPPPCQ